jgi:hypothetical protein
MVKHRPKRWKGHCMLHEKWRVNGRKNESRSRADRKVTGRVRRWQNHRGDDW